MTREMLQAKVGPMSPEEINDYTGLYCYEDERKAPEELSIDEAMRYHSTSELIEWLIDRGASMTMFAMLCERGVIKREKIEPISDKDEKENILELAVTYHWYDEIESGRKKEEYRKDVPYYERRLMYPNSSEGIWKKYDAIRFRRGRFGKKTMLLEHKGTCRGIGRPEWGAPEDEVVFIIMLGDIISKSK